MKKLYSLSAIIFSCCTFAFSQSTLTETNSTPPIGNTYTYGHITNISVPIDGGGANQVWDFSTANASFSFDTDILSVQDATDGSSFPTADRVQSVPGSEYFYSIDANQMSIIGRHHPSSLSRVVFTDPELELQFPLTYGSSFTDTFAAEIHDLQFSGTSYRLGNKTISGDAHGQLILPFGTFDDVIRVKTTASYEDANAQGNVFRTYTDTIYRWYDANTKSHLAHFVKAYSDGQLQLSWLRIIDEGSVAGPASVNELAQTSILLYPNPANNQIHIESEVEISNITIHSTQGRMVCSFSEHGMNLTLDSSELPAGVYFLRYVVNGMLQTEKVVLE